MATLSNSRNHRGVHEFQLPSGKSLHGNEAERAVVSAVFKCFNCPQASLFMATEPYPKDKVSES